MFQHTKDYKNWDFDAIKLCLQNKKFISISWKEECDGWLFTIYKLLSFDKVQIVFGKPFILG